jgi:hypothetical protein
MDEMDEKVRELAWRRRRPLREAAWALELAISGPAGTGTVWRERVHTRALQVRAALEDHIAEVESPGGLTDQVTVDAPRLIHRMNVLLAEHTELRAAIARILEACGGPAGLSEEQAAMVRQETMALLVGISRHRQKGADLVYQAYEVDIGGE